MDLRESKKDLIVDKKTDTDGIQERISRITAKLETMAVPMDIRKFTREEYNRLFPEGKVKTPFGEVKLGAGQFDKLAAKGREKLLGAMYQTLTDPVVILPETRNGKDSRLYIKTFKAFPNDERKNVMVVVVDIEGKAIAVSSGKRRNEQIEAKIKQASIPLYLKG
jgi:hypothetical protein